MTTKRKLGVFFGRKYFCIAEAEKKKLVQYITTQHGLFSVDQSSLQNIPTDIKLTALIQKSLREHQIETSKVNLTLPTRDIILRSFFIPWMTAAEVKGVVEFEINRYIPFKLDELASSYHASTVLENKTKKIRILFVAIRKDILERYCSVLEQADLQVVSIEPEPLSLARLLSHKKLLQTNQKTAIIQAGKDEGTIIIVDQGIPQFVREFRLWVPSQGSLEPEPEVLKARLFNEIKISLDYYSRQHTQSKVDKILFLSLNADPGMSENLTKDLGIPAQPLEASSVLELQEEVNPGILNAFGASLKDTVPSSTRIDLVKARLKEVEEEDLEPKTLDFTMMVKIGIACAAILLISFFVSHRSTASHIAKLNAINQKQGLYESFTIDQLTSRKMEISKKLSSYKSVRIKSDIAFFLKRIPELLPQGSWLTNLSIDYKNTPSRQKDKGRSGKQEISILMDGYVYAEDINQQINIVNRLPVSFRADQEFFNFFNEANLVAAEKKELEDYTVTYFQISLK